MGSKLCAAYDTERPAEQDTMRSLDKTKTMFFEAALGMNENTSNTLIPDLTKENTPYKP